MEILDENVPIRKQGKIMKQGGAEGGHKSWREREYYPDEAAFKGGQKPYVIRLNAFFVAAVEGSTDNEFTIHAYPKSVTCRASNAADMQEWIRALMEPVERKRRPIRTIQGERKAAESKIEEDAKTGEPIKGITIPSMAAEVASLAGASVGGGGAGGAAGGGGGK